MAVLGDKQMRQGITVPGKLSKIWFHKCSCEISSKLRKYFENILKISYFGSIVSDSHSRTLFNNLWSFLTHMDTTYAFCNTV